LRPHCRRAGGRPRAADAPAHAPARDDPGQPHLRLRRLYRRATRLLATSVAGILLGEPAVRSASCLRPVQVPDLASVSRTQTRWVGYSFPTRADVLIRPYSPRIRLA